MYGVRVESSGKIFSRRDLHCLLNELTKGNANRLARLMKTSLTQVSLFLLTLFKQRHL
jgi:hypothetical protein